MKLLAFAQKADPQRLPRLGAVLPDGVTVVDLQAAHFSMHGAPAPVLTSLESFRQAGEDSRTLAREVVDWVTTQNPPGVRTSLSEIRPLAPILDVV